MKLGNRVNKRTGKNEPVTASIYIVDCSDFRHVANGEILGVSLLMEDVLQTGYQDISHLSDADDLETARSEKKEGSLAPSRGASRLDMQTPTGSISSKAGKGWGSPETGWNWPIFTNIRNNCYHCWMWCCIYLRIRGHLNFGIAINILKFFFFYIVWLPCIVLT